MRLWCCAHRLRQRAPGRRPVRWRWWVGCAHTLHAARCARTTAVPYAGAAQSVRWAASYCITVTVRGCLVRPAQAQRASANLRKNEGNILYAARHYEAALLCYTEALGIDPSCHIYYCNRSTCQAKLGLWQVSVMAAHTQRPRVPSVCSLLTSTRCGIILSPCLHHHGTTYGRSQPRTPDSVCSWHPVLSRHTCG